VLSRVSSETWLRFQRLEPDAVIAGKRLALVVRVVDDLARDLLRE
jgi:hypothetical protein